MFNELLSIAFYNLLHRKLRSFLTLLGIVIGVSAVVGIITLGISLQENVTKQLMKFGSDQIAVVGGSFKFSQLRTSMLTTLTFKFSENDLNAIKNAPGVEEVYGAITNSEIISYYNENITNVVYGINIKSWMDIEGNKIGLYKGRVPETDEKYVAIIGYSIAKDSFSKEIDINKKIKIKNKEFKVVGILNQAGGVLSSSIDNVILIPYDTLIEINPNKFKKGEYTVFELKISKGFTSDEVVENVNKALLKSRHETEETKTFSVLGAKFYQETINSIFGIITVFLGAIAAISLIVGGIGISNTMYVSVMERTREIGLMKAVGATNKTILLLFLIESGLLGLLGGIIGTILGIFFSYIFSFILSSEHFLMIKGFSIFIDPLIILLGFFFGFFTGILAGFFPAKTAANLQPVEALRYE
ncbi:MAG: ABC transporter permease [Candidatus Aenigmatarchaeota archaeon]